MYQWLCLLGVPSVMLLLLQFIHSQLKQTRKDSAALKSGMQALLRAQMIGDYNKWNERGYAPIYARENFQNCWTQYEALGANGVMCDIHEKFLALPIEPPREEKYIV